MHYLLILSLLILSPLYAQAESTQPAGTRITISATAERELPNDEVVITYRVEQEGKDANAIRQQVNRVTDLIHKRLQKEAALKIKTTSRNMQPVWHYPKNQPRIRTAWRMSQSEEITSSNLEAVPQWLETIEGEGAQLSNLQFRVSRQLSLQTEEALRLQAIRTFRSNAVALTNGLDAASFRIIHLNSSSQSPRPVLYRSEMAMMAKSSDAVAPSLSAGEGTVRITVNGEIEIPFIDFPAK
ncbi:SIMPL domain-containing protein [Mariprofundus sp. KV]|uniref:SIMPL domain-containing protein n=1 Tax=Mariprofundus sp. KV TaxID=2608715 RepID=UPI0015A06F21|nr:SIMPL domain-containing protein [Mariprofundus sp. KV]NWF35301.1 DUF541 domain-containing protein [Mariprofundus sp. KV]